MNPVDTPFTRDAGVEIPLICGAMYPCSNPELVAAASAAGALGVVQPVSLTWVYGHDFREGLRLIRSLTNHPIGFNALIEQSSSVYRKRMEQWIKIALEEGIRFFITSLGNPRWVVEMVQPAGGRVYHDVTTLRWAEKALQGGVHGLIAVNQDAGGHPGDHTAEELIKELKPLGLPVIAAGGIGDAVQFRSMLEMGYDGVQCGTRFIATTECLAGQAYKEAILTAGADDIVRTERLTGVPVAVIRTPAIERLGYHASPLAKWLLRGRKTRHWMRAWYALRSAGLLRHSLRQPASHTVYWQAGRSVASIDRVETVAEVIAGFRQALYRSDFQRHS